MSKHKELEFIDLKQADGEGRVSSLIVQESHLQVTGNLPHGYRFHPASTHDADKLIAWLKQWKEGHADSRQQNGDHNLDTGTPPMRDSEPV